jgi:hypothetical protein
MQNLDSSTSIKYQTLFVDCTNIYDVGNPRAFHVKQIAYLARLQALSRTNGLPAQIIKMMKFLRFSILY